MVQGIVTLVLFMTWLVTGWAKTHDVRAAGLGGKIPSLLKQDSLSLLACPVIWPVTPSSRLAPKRLPFCPLLLLLLPPQHQQASTNQPSYHSTPLTTAYSVQGHTVTVTCILTPFTCLQVYTPYTHLQVGEVNNG